MKKRRVEFSQAARSDLFAIYDWINQASGWETATGYIERLERYCIGFGVASERGMSHDELYPGLRVVGFERRVAIAFLVRDESVVIVRLFYGGQDWRKSFEDDPGINL